VTKLHDLFTLEGQSPWLDNLRREDLQSGHLQDLINRGVRGVTSNPTIFHKSITGSSAYDSQIAECHAAGMDVQTTYWKLVTTDISAACDLLAPIHGLSGGDDGFVSLEVDPHLAHDADLTIAAAHELMAMVDRRNLMIKVPATDAGLTAIESLIGDGISVNVTLIFGLRRYLQVLTAFSSGTRICARRWPTRLSGMRSVASFFVSRLDSAIDLLLSERAAPNLAGRAAVAQARLAYALQTDFFGERDWSQLASQGAFAQRPLWASTSTKNASYPDLIYVDSLIGPGSVNTLPEATLNAFEDHGTVSRTIDLGLAEAQAHRSSLNRLGIDIDDVENSLEADGLRSFKQSFDDLLESLRGRMP